MLDRRDNTVSQPMAVTAAPQVAARGMTAAAAHHPFDACFLREGQLCIL